MKIQIIGIIIQTLIIAFYGICMYRYGVKAGTHNAVIKVLKDEGVVTEENKNYE